MRDGSDGDGRPDDVGGIEEAELRRSGRGVVDEPDEPSTVGVPPSRRVGDEHEVARHVSLEVAVHVARPEEIVVADGPMTRGPQAAWCSISLHVAAVGEVSRRRIQHFALDVPGFGVQRPSLEQRGEYEQHDRTAGVVRM